MPWSKLKSVVRGCLKKKKQKHHLGEAVVDLGPRRFLFRHTFGRLRSEEAMFVRAEKNVNELNLSGELMKKESKKLLERAALAEKDMIRGETELK
ncbi:hypothetical protein KPL71_026312 [Citrus sinensis]|uniref:Uncharacterized protein n=1 Tax=Citrus sinensis TaxID=2711 RepID=A0ACB8HYH2_CITSI|nr:hypothetical protein KPL71_026312 [Citrus sinensis]